ncbi:hypothetical protein NPIL_209211 [Nephila pilipes]|uniref:Uncharacterized protein n=1 Tax=Nephila pilipes TaxID=299642 RepID=A0A8X6TZ49_NEPPI|nr:hypothetical protein NPIL_209211 [Nephila pilipes]
MKNSVQTGQISQESTATPERIRTEKYEPFVMLDEEEEEKLRKCYERKALESAFEVSRKLIFYFQVHHQQAFDAQSQEFQEISKKYPKREQLPSQTNRNRTFTSEEEKENLSYAEAFNPEKSSQKNPSSNTPENQSIENDQSPIATKDNFSILDAIKEIQHLFVSLPQILNACKKMRNAEDKFYKLNIFLSRISFSPSLKIFQ